MNKQNYHDVMSAKLEEWEASFEVAKAKVRTEVADVAGEGLDEARKRRDELRAKLALLLTATEATWERLKEEVQDAWKKLRRPN